jgi:hypothetical protein
MLVAARHEHQRLQGSGGIGPESRRIRKLSVRLDDAKARERLLRVPQLQKWWVNERSDRAPQKRLARRARFHLMSAPVGGNVLMT